MKLKSLTVIGVAGATAVTILAGPAVATTTHRTTVIAACTTAKYRPHHYILTCADANTQIRGATYSSWTATSAAGKGTFVYNTCTPDCASGTFKHHPITFTLGRPRTVGGKRWFTRLYATYAGLSETFQLPTSGT